LTTLLDTLVQPKARYKIYAMQLVSTKSTRVITILENDLPRWQGTLPQKGNIRIDFGSTGWELEPGSELIIGASGKLTMDVNILQWGILQGNENG
jgi:hypothetical protein